MFVKFNGRLIIRCKYSRRRCPMILDKNPYVSFGMDPILDIRCSDIRDAMRNEDIWRPTLSCILCGECR